MHYPLASFVYNVRGIGAHRMMGGSEHMLFGTSEREPKRDSNP
jgi:hypothetical protein